MASTALAAHVCETVSKQSGVGGVFMSRIEPKSVKGIDRSLGHTGISSLGALAMAAVQGMGVESG